MRAHELYKVLYICCSAALVGFVAAFALVALTEAYGPSNSEPGRVIERVESEYSQTRCVRGQGCTSQSFPAYTVIGEREDGSTWIVTGQGPYDAMQGEHDQIRVATSPITGRVVALRGSGSSDFWGVRGSAMVVFAIGALIVVGGLFGLFEWSRHKADNWGWGPFKPQQLLAVAPGLALAMFALWYVVWQPTHGLQAVSSQERYGDFLATPLATMTASPPDDVAEDAIVAGIPFGNGAMDLIVASPDQLTAAYRSRVDTSHGLAIPIAIKENYGGLAKVTVRGSDPVGERYDPIDCATGEPNTRASRFGLALDLEPIGVDPDVGATVVCLPPQATGTVEIVVESGIPRVYLLQAGQLSD